MFLIEAWNAMGYTARAILVVLATFASLVLFIIVDRSLAYRRAEHAPGNVPSPRRARLQRHMHTLAAIKVTAPMVGLLGTLLGLIHAFTGLAMSGVLDLRMVEVGVAEALVTTVLGLVIGLPAWWAHAFFAAWGERILAQQDGVRPVVG